MKLTSTVHSKSADQSAGAPNTADITLSITVTLRPPLPGETEGAYLDYCERMVTGDLQGQIKKGFVGLVEAYQAKVADGQN